MVICSYYCGYMARLFIDIPATSYPGKRAPSLRPVCAGLEASLTSLVILDVDDILEMEGDRRIR